VFDKLDREARVCATMAQELARSVRHARIGADHLLLALVKGETEPVTSVCDRAGIDPSAIVEVVEGRMRPGRRAPEGGLRFDPSGREALELAFRESLLLEHDWVGTGHLLVGALDAAGLPFDRERVREAVRDTRPAAEHPPA
jgi:ATP-dependent Clp protease ATP-binding subunit ClpA